MLSRIYCINLEFCCIDRRVFGMDKTVVWGETCTQRPIEQASVREATDRRLAGPPGPARSASSRHHIPHLTFPLQPPAITIISLGIVYHKCRLGWNDILFQRLQLNAMPSNSPHDDNSILYIQRRLGDGHPLEKSW